MLLVYWTNLVFGLTNEEFVHVKLNHIKFVFQTANRGVYHFF